MPRVMVAESSQGVLSLLLPSVEDSYLTLGHTPFRWTAHTQGAKCNEVADVIQHLMVLLLCPLVEILFWGSGPLDPQCPELQRQKA